MGRSRHSLGFLTLLGGLPGLLLMPVMAQADDPIEVGQSLEEVIEVLGTPRGHVDLGSESFLSYERGEVRLRDGEVESFDLVSPEKAREREQARRKRHARFEERRAERARREAEAREQARLEAELEAERRAREALKDEVMDLRVEMARQSGRLEGTLRDTGDESGRLSGDSISVVAGRDAVVMREAPHPPRLLHSTIVVSPPEKTTPFRRSGLEERRDLSKRDRRGDTRRVDPAPTRPAHQVRPHSVPGLHPPIDHLEPPRRSDRSRGRRR